MTSNAAPRWVNAVEPVAARPLDHDELYNELVAMLEECKSFVGGVAIADERGDQWRWKLYPRLKDLLLKVDSGG